MNQYSTTPNSVLQRDEVLDIKQATGILKRRIGIILATALLVFTLVAVVTFQQTPLYTASARVMIDVRGKDVTNIEEVLAGVSSDATAINSEVELLKSRELAKKVVTELQLQQNDEFNGTPPPPSFLDTLRSQVTGWIQSFLPQQTSQPQQSPPETEDRALERITSIVLGGLEVQRVGATYVIEILFTSKNPDSAALVANQFAEQYLLEQLEAKFDATARANDWLSDRLSTLREDVQNSEAAVELYRAQSGLLSARGASLTEQQISDLNAQVVIERAELRGAEARLQSVEDMLSRGASVDTIGDVMNSGAIQELKQRQSTVAQRKAELSTRYGELHPEILKVDREAADLAQQMENEIDRIVQSIETQVQVSREKVRSLEASLNSLRGELAQNNQSLVRLRELERNAEVNRTLYESFLNRFKETGEQESLAEADARVISRALRGGKSAPNTKLNLAAGLLLGVALGLILAVALEVFDQGVKSGTKIEQAIGIPFVASIPRLYPGIIGKLRKLLGKATPPQDYVLEKPFSSFAESYRTIRSAVLLSTDAKDGAVLAIASALPGEGKTTSVLCLGRVSALAGSKTVILDCDLRRQTLTKSASFSTKRDTEPKGLTEFLNGDATLDDILMKDEQTNCYVIPLTANSNSPKDVFTAPGFDKLLNELRKQFDLIILDTPPILPVSETRLIIDQCDGVLLLARWGKTKKSALVSANDILRKLTAKPVGSALTQVNFLARSSSGYGDYYDHYSAYRKYYVD
ncbi:MAG: capsular biosynthesis protein [Ponticaulis sp.]|nr:capsular biosynthesis protein [Ponticaulis sp.]|tara:strand:- start:156 stop:2414 length:2259 start_codon:yes stop_codon:yes gene_type:complete